MKTIWKFELKIEPEQILKVPKDAEILDIKMQVKTVSPSGSANIVPMMWVVCDPKKELIEIKINMVGTGWDFDYSKNTYLATVIDGALVWHFFMEN